MGDWLKRLTARLFRGETFFFLVLLVTLPATVMAQAAPHRAGLVIRFGDGSVVTRCVSFSEPSISGVELLTRAGLSIRVDASSSIGAGVCKIGAQGCDAGKSCFCQCEGSTCAYWQYFHLQSGAWKYSNLGAGIYQLSDGAVEGWVWGNNIVLPLMTLDQICAAGESEVAAPSAAASASPVPTHAPENTLTPTSQPAKPTALSMAAPATTATATTEPTVTPTLFVPSATSSPFASPALPPASPTATPTFIPPPQNTGVPSSVVSYTVFGVIVVGLLAWLAIQARRKV